MYLDRISGEFINKDKNKLRWISESVSGELINWKNSLVVVFFFLALLRF